MSNQIIMEQNVKCIAKDTTNTIQTDDDYTIYSFVICGSLKRLGEKFKSS